MSNIESQIQRLKSPNKNTRYDACEMLRVAASIPPEALDALRAATYDSDRLVAEAAQDALVAHLEPAPAMLVQTRRESGFWENPWKKLPAVALLFLAAFLAQSELTWLSWRVQLPVSSGWFLIFPGACIAFLPRTGDYFPPEALVAGWSIYLCMTLAIVAIDEGRVAKVLYAVLAFLLLVNLVAWGLFFG